MVVLKNCDPELSYILAEPFNMSERVLFSRLLEHLIGGSCIYECWERSTAKNYCPVSLLSVISKVFGKLVNNWILDHLERCGLLSDFQYGFRSCQSTTDLLTVVSYRIVKEFSRSGGTPAVALLTGFGMLVFFTNLSLTEFQVRYLALFLLF